MFEEFIPDLDAYSDAWVTNANASMQKKDLETQIDDLVANVYIDCVNIPQYQISGKPPAISFIKESYAKIGHNTDTVLALAALKRELIAVEGKLKESAGVIKVEEMKLSLYQTMSANSRNIQGI